MWLQVQVQMVASVSQSVALIRDYAELSKPRVIALQLWILNLLMVTYAHQAHDSFHSKTKLSHLVMDETLGT